MEFKANDKKKVEIEVDGVIYQRHAIKTHFVNIGESYIDLVNKYVKPIYKEGDIVSMGAKIISLCQKRVVYRKDLKISWLAKFLSSFATQHSAAGIGVGEVCKMQCAIDFVGAPKVLWAAIAGGVCKILGKRGVFYDIVGYEVTGLDGFYPDVFPEYGDFGVRIPENPNGVCDEIFEKTGVRAMLVDANDFERVILGVSNKIDLPKEKLKELIRDNPSGQDDQCTPFILIRKKGK